ncbi:unnamed protein product [Timema podura]|uniref:DRBM domain-containing protein n=1 Tax=Timema podura TaxID=61482 RepID=A0ABN7P341_TIMPD|nr:unnamed protein product [Timema podura]
MEMSITEHIRKLADMHPVPQLQHLCQVYAWVRPQYQSSYENFKKDVCVITCTVNGFKTIGWGQKKRVAKFWAAEKMLVHLEENQDCEQFSYGYQVPLKIALEQTNVGTRDLEEISNVPKNVSCHSLQSLTTEEEVFENHSKDSLIPESNGETNVIVKNDVDASSTPEFKKDDSIFSESKEDVKIMISYYEDASKISESKEDAKIMKNYYEYASKISESKEDLKIMINYYEDASKISESKEDAKIMQEYDEDASIFVGEGNVGLYPIWFKISPRSPGQGAEERTLHKKLENTKHLTFLGQNNSRVLNEIEKISHPSHQVLQQLGSRVYKSIIKFRYGMVIISRRGNGKSGLHCSTICGACAGESCTNRLEIDVDDDLDTVECVDEVDSHDKLESCDT